jgi:SAM-dependent methyltransferase
MISRQLRRPLSYAVEYTFDRRHAVDTRGRRLVTGEVMARSEYRDVVAYEATSALRLKRLLRSLPAIDPADLTFIDLGCGKGATLVVAAQQGFKRVVGVELDSQLAEVARTNARVVHERTSRPVEVVESDASAYQLPLEPGVVYLFNPFGLHTMRSVADAVMASLVQCPRPLFVVYLNPLHRCVWDETGVLRPISSGRGWVIYAAVGATDGQSR